MDEKKKVIPIQKSKYTLSDLSVVIPQASQYVKRIAWFLEQYVKGTPKEVINNTIVAYDPEDDYTKVLLEKYQINGLTVQPPQSTYKMEAGFRQVKTRLCVRIHNDTFMVRDDWAQALVDQFNVEEVPQIIGYYHPSGIITKDLIDKFLEWYPSFKPVYDSLEFNELEQIGTPFLGAYFIASQTVILRGLYPLLVDFNEGRMNKEDCLLMLFASHFGINITTWRNQFEFVQTVSPSYGDFDEGTDLPTEPYHAVENDPYKAVFGKAVELWA